MLRKYVIAALCTIAWLALFEQHISPAAAQQDQDTGSSVVDLISKLKSDNITELENARNSLKAKGSTVLTDLRTKAKTADRDNLFQITRLYAEMIIDLGVDPEKDSFILGTINGDYYQTKFIVLQILAKRGHMQFVINEAKKISEPSADDDRVFNEIINAMRVSKGDFKFYNSTAIEEAYLTQMGKRINSKLEHLISDESEKYIVRQKLLWVYRQINRKDSNVFFLKLLSQPISLEFKKYLISDLNIDYNKNDAELIERVQSLRDKESDKELRETYDRLIKNLTSGWNK